MLTDFHHNSTNLVLDPSHMEASIATGTLTLTLNAQRELCVLSKAGGTPLAKHELMRVIRLGVERVRDMTNALEDALHEDELVRVIEVR
jgi:exosome complex component RRP45